jgi:hypothetical protein
MSRSRTNSTRSINSSSLLPRIITVFIFTPLKTRCPRRVETAQDLAEVANAGDLPEAIGAQRIEADVDALDAGSTQRRRKAIELRTIGGDHQFVQTRQASQLFEQPDRVLPDQWFTAGNAHLGHAKIDEGTLAMRRHSSSVNTCARGRKVISSAMQ